MKKFLSVVLLLIVGSVGSFYSYGFYHENDCLEELQMVEHYDRMIDLFAKHLAIAEEDYEQAWTMWAFAYGQFMDNQTSETYNNLMLAEAILNNADNDVSFNADGLAFCNEKRDEKEYEYCSCLEANSGDNNDDEYEENYPPGGGW